jgi:hypothetical protein
MGWSDESARALRDCVRILASYYDAADRRRMAKDTERWIKEGVMPAWSLEDISRLFYPTDAAAASRLRGAMEQAYAVGDLIGYFDLPVEKLSDQCFLPSHLCAWQACPSIPENSPLRQWIPLPRDRESTSEQRRARYLEMVREEAIAKGRRGAVQRAAKREGVSRQTFLQRFGAGTTVKSLLDKLAK